MSEEINSSSRRSFLKKTGAAGILPLASVAGESGATVQIPVLRNQNGVVKWETVPKSWNQHRKKAERQVQNFQNEHRGKPGVVETGLVASSKTHGGKRGFEIEVAIDPGRQENEMPDSYNGIEVRKTERREPHADLCWNHDYDDGRIPGGVAIYNENSQGGTSGWQLVVDSDPAEFTAEHVAQTGENVYGDDEGSGSAEQIGYVSTDDASVDAAAIKSDTRQPTAEIHGESQSWNQGGWVTESGVSNRVSNAFDGYRKMGSTTGETTGGLGKYKIDDSYSSQTPSYDGEGVRGSADAAGGDSGGPAFSLHNGSAYIIYPITQGDPKAGQRSSNSNCRDNDPYKKSLGTAAYHLNTVGFQTTGSSHS